MHPFTKCRSIRYFSQSPLKRVFESSPDMTLDVAGNNQATSFYLFLVVACFAVVVWYCPLPTPVLSAKQAAQRLQCTQYVMCICKTHRCMSHTTHIHTIYAYHTCIPQTYPHTTLHTLPNTRRIHRVHTTLKLPNSHNTHPPHTHIYHTLSTPHTYITNTTLSTYSHIPHSPHTSHIHHKYHTIHLLTYTTLSTHITHT